MSKQGKGAAPAAESRPKNRAGRPTQDELQRRKSKIMQVAEALFIRHGFAATTIVEIASGAGVATRTVYEHFGDKEAIFRSVALAGQKANVFPPPMIDESSTLNEVIMALAKYAFEVAYRPGAVDNRCLLVGESKRFPELAKHIFELGYEKFRSNIKWTFDELVAGGVFTDSDTGTSAEIFIDLILGAGAMYVVAGWEAPNADISEKVDLFIRGRWGVQDAGRFPISASQRK